MVSVANVVSVSASVPNGGYRAGDTIWVDVTFTESVFVNTAGGIPSLQMSSSGSAVYTRGSGSEVLTFSYTVPAGANSIDLDYSSTDALRLNGATIDADLALAPPGTPGSLGANSNIIIDSTAPTNTIASFAFQPTQAIPRLTSSPKPPLKPSAGRLARILPWARTCMCL